MNSKNKLADMPTGYSVNIVGRHVAVTDAMKSYAEEKLAKVERLSNKIIEAIVTMDIQKLEHRVDIVLKFNHWKIKVTATSENMYASIDKAVDRLQSKVRKYKEKIVEHQAKPLDVIDMNVNVLGRHVDETEEVNSDIEGENLRRLEDEYRPHRIVASETRPLKMLTTEEAVIKMDLSGDGFLIFRSEEDQKLKVIYRREDGEFGIIEPE